MMPQLLCLLCTFRTAYDLAKKSTNDEKLQTKIILETARSLAAIDEMNTLIPAALHTQVCRMARRITGNPDPFSRLIMFSNDQALKMLPALEEKIKASRDTNEAVRLAVKMAICENVIDFEVENYDFSLEGFDSQLIGCLEKGLAIDHTVLLMQQLERSGEVLYLLDNAGEIVFGKSLIDFLKMTPE